MSRVERDIPILLERVPYGEVEADLPPAPSTSIGIHLSGTCRLEWRVGRMPTVALPTRGVVTLVPQGSAGSLRVRGDGCEILKLQLPDTAVRRWSDVNERPLLAPFVERVGVVDGLVLHLGLSLLEEHERPRAVDRLYEDTLTNTLIAHLVRHYTGQAGPRSDRVHPLSLARSRRALDYLEANLHAPIRLDDVAAELGMSTSHFTAQFTRAFGRSPARYITWLRLQRARELLERTAQPVGVVAHAVGFNSFSHFSHAFKREYGCSPTRLGARSADPPLVL